MQNDTFVRVATDKDLIEIIPLLKALGYDTTDMLGIQKTWQEIATNQDMGILVAVTNNKISGYLIYSIKPQLRFAGSSMEVDELSVDSLLRGHGIGSKLLDHIKKIAIDQGIKQIILSTNKNRESYRRDFYTKNGFVEKNSAWMKIDLSKSR